MFKIFFVKCQHMAQKMKALEELVILMYHTPHLITKFGVTYPPNSGPPGVQGKNTPGVNPIWPPLLIPPTLDHILEMRLPPNLIL